MTGLLDLSLLGGDRGALAARGGALALHQAWLKRCALRLLWCEDFAADLPWTEPAQRGLCVALSQLLEHLRGNGRLLLEAAPAPALLPVLSPPLADTYAPERRSRWLGLLCGALRDEAAYRAGLAVLTQSRPDLAAAYEVHIANAADLGAAGETLHALHSEPTWHAFWQRYHRPDLSQRRVAVLGGQRAWVERAGQTLRDLYRLGRFRYLAPAYEQTRTKKETQDALADMDLLIVCTNRLKHTDTDHLKGAPLRCARIDCNNDSSETIVRAVVAHFLRGELTDRP